MPALDVRGLSGCFPTGRLLLVGQHFLSGFPTVSAAVTGAKSGGNPLPEFLPSLGAALACGRRHDLPCLAAQRDPDPLLLGFFQDQ